jgi:hypothetical protein
MTRHLTEAEAMLQVAVGEMTSGLEALKGEMLALAEVIPSLASGQFASLSPAEMVRQDAECEAQFDNMPV